jgi:hypothetical protein
MSVHAGSILHLGSQTVIDRIQSAGLGDVRLPIETIREVGNREVVDKVPQEPDFTFTMESLDVSTDLMAFLTGQPVTGSGSAIAPGAVDPPGTSYDWLDCKFVNIVSPWKDPNTGSAGVVEAGHLIPGYYPTRLRYRFGVTDNATQEVELGGGSFFYAEFAPFEQQETGDGSTTVYTTDDPAIHYRRGGGTGTTFRSIFGVLVDGQLQTEGVDYTVSGGAADPGAVATLTFEEAPDNGADIRFCYFTSAAQSFPQTVHASVVVKPGAVRGRNIKVLIEGSRIGGIQSAELEATVDGEVERELGTEDIVGRVVNGTDANGSLTIRSKDKDAFFDVLATVTGVSRDEVFGWFNDNTVDLQIKIENPRNPGVIIKTIRIEDAKFQPPGTPARVNTATDFAVNFESLNGTFKEYKGEPQP